MRVLPLIFAVAFAIVPQTDRPPAGLAAEMDRIRTEAAASTPQEENAAPAARLDRAGAALAAGRPLLALYLFEMPWESATAWTFVKASSAVTTADAFDRKWRETGEPRVTRASARDGARRAALIDALASAAEARGPITYHASRAYGQDAGVAAGVYYLGESHAAVKFATFARSLTWPAAGGAPPLRSIAPELSALDADMTTAYESMDRSSHSTYIVASAALKQARSLDDSGAYAGALFEYLLARYIFAPLRGPAAQDATVERIDEARKALPAGMDHSIAELFLQLAEEGVVGSVPAQRRGAAAALEDVIPAYLRAIAPSTIVTAAVPHSNVTVTLVRWPFT
jgi:hypothetical protein